MKKCLLVLSVLALLATSAFASVTSISKEASEAGYPGVLTKGSVTGLDTFTADLPSLANIALFEYIDNGYKNYDGPVGLVVLKSDIGTLGLSINTTSGSSVNGINSNNMNTVGL